jgi:hypothetical protein
MLLIKLTAICLRGLGSLVRIGCLFFAAQFLLQGVAQLDVEGLAKQAETADQAWGRVRFAAILVAAGLSGEVIRQLGRILATGLTPTLAARLRKAGFDMALFWAGACLFVCLLVLAGSLRTRWPVLRAYYWAAGGAGALAVLFLGAVAVLYQETPSSTER